ncbi:MAG: S8 family serine peptidase [Lachnospiraceae bacterium]|jgi:serine protease AprX|nr:S8 family serine peptidase [Lachnospiraceae bacterium]
MQRVREQVGIFSEEETATGEGVTVGVLDTGVGHHPDLAGRILCFRDFVGRRNLMYDNSGHGTHVCGILCGSGALSGGRCRGMAPGVRLVVGKVLDDRGGGSTESMLAGLEWILQVRERYGIRILNISVGIGSLEEETKERALQEKLEEVWESGILVVCAAGNKGPGDGTISGLGQSRHVLTVGCHDGDYFRDSPGRCETYSGRGKRDGSLRKPDIVAPGTDIYSCNVGYYRRNGKVRNAYVAKSGTSMATPVAAGAAALALQRYPGMSNEACRQKLQFTATDLGLPWNRQGWGMVNVKRLLE